MHALAAKVSSIGFVPKNSNHLNKFLKCSIFKLILYSIPKSLPIATAFALDAKKNKNVKNLSSYQFEVVKVASVLGWSGASVKRALKNLEWNGIFFFTLIIFI